MIYIREERPEDIEAIRADESGRLLGRPQQSQGRETPGGAYWYAKALKAARVVKPDPSSRQRF